MDKEGLYTTFSAEYIKKIGYIDKEELDNSFSVQYIV